MKKIVNLDRIPQLPGVYLIKDKYDKIIYIGKAKNLKKRVNSYFTDKYDFSFKARGIKLFAFKLDFIICDSEREAFVIERRLISEFKPFFNVLWKDSKTYPYILITKEDFSRLIITRNTEHKGYYFGPYPKVDIVKRLIERLNEMKIINLRKCDFKFSIKNPLNIKKRNRCIYYHTEQCLSPCDDNKVSQIEYLEFVSNAINFFKGRYNKVVKYFFKKMKESSYRLDYENAKVYRDAIKAIEHINERVSINELNINEIESKANFTKTLLQIKDKLGLRKIPYHIESFDISNLLNKYAVGAMVCFINGKKNHSHYRRYKINFKPLNAGNDYEMMYEIVNRRIKEIKLQKNLPDLFLVDGGKGQLLAGFRAIKESGVDIDIISLAKKNEEMFTTNSKKSIILEKDLPEILFLMSVRDETHRFAISYHKKLRTKEFFI